MTERQQDQEKLRVFDGLPLGTDKVLALSPDCLRAVLDALMTVTVAPVGKGGYTFHRDRVAIEWKQDA